MKYSEVIPAFFIVGVKDFSFSKELQSLLKEFPVKGLALFNSPFDNPLNVWNDREAALEMVYEFSIKALEQVHFLSADQEGGRVRRLRSPFVHLPSAQKVRDSFERLGKMSLIENLYSLSAKQMALTGIRLNFAPVCDWKYEASSNVVGDRSYGGTFKEAFPFVEAFCRAYENEGVKTTLKHFPGHGPTKFDSHEKIAVTFKSKKDIFKEDREMFLKAAKHSSAVMTAHIAFEENPETIFSLDEKLLTEFKKGMPENLFWITDDLLSMKAVSERKPWLKAYQCKYDFILICGTIEESVKAIEETIRFAERTSLPFSEELEIEKRAKRSAEFINTGEKLPSFNEWRKQILEIETLGNECLEKLEIKI